MKRKLLLAALCVVGALGKLSATDYLTDFSEYTVTKTAVSNDATSGTAREFWRGGVLNFDVNGTSTELPNGVYSFSVQAVYRGHLTKDIPTGIIAYAESDGAQYMTPICNKTDGTVETISLGGFAEAFGTASNYLNTIPYIIVTDGKIKVGVKSMSTQPFCDNGMWFIFNTASFKVTEVTDNDVLATALADIKAQAEGLLASNSDASTERSNLQSAYDAATATAENIVNVKQKIDAYLAKLVELAELESPLDVSYYFTNPKYSIRNLDLVGGLVTSGKEGALGQPFGWTCFDAGGTGDNGSGNAFQEAQGFNFFTTIGNTTTYDSQAANYDADKSGGYSIYQRISWNQWAEQTHSAKQTVTLPAGKYKLSVPAYASAKNDDYKGYVIFKVGATENSNEVTAGSWNVYEMEFTITETTEVSVDMQFNKLRRKENVGKQYAYFDGVTLLAYGDPLKALKADLTALEGTLSGILADENYENVVGTERTALSGYSRPALEETNEAYQGAIDDLQAAIDAFTGAKTNYDLLVTEIAKAAALGLDASEYAATSSSTAATALTATQNVKVAEYTYVISTYAYGVSLGEWTSTGTNTSAATFSNEHWSGTTHDYKNQYDSWGNPKQGYAADSWSINFSQNVALPAGNYVFKVAGRQASGDKVTTSLVVTKTSDSSVLGTVSDFPRSNNSRGINTSGATDFATGEGHTYANNGNGYGWEWRYVKFTLAEDATVNVAISSVATDYNQWVSFGDYTLQTDEEANIALITYNVALANAQTVIADGQYSNVTGSEKTNLQNAIAADATLNKNSKTDIEAATTTLNNAAAAFTAAKSAYNAYVAAKAVVYEDNLPYASSAKFAAIGTAQSAADATSASDATTKTNAIINAYRLYVESNAMAEGVTGAEDKTDLISDPNLDVTISEMTAGAWTFTQGGGSAEILDGEPLTDGAGSSSYKYYNYNNGDNNNQHLYQTISSLPAGRYLLTTSARAATAFNNYFYLSVKDGEAAAQTANIPAVGNSGGTFGRGWNDASIEFVHPTEGDVEIKVYSDGGSGSAKRSGWWGATRFRLVRLGDAAESVTVTTAGWATLYSDYALDFSGTGLTAYTATISENTVTLTEVENVPAGTGVVLKGAGDYTIPMIASSETAKGDLTGSTTGSTAYDAYPGYDLYMLALNGNEVQFTKVTSGSIAKGKAFLKVASSNSNAKLRVIFADNATAISGVESKKAENGVMYNLAGQRVGKDYKGIVIVNGKKVMNK